MGEKREISLRPWILIRKSLAWFLQLFIVSGPFWHFKLPFFCMLACLHSWNLGLRRKIDGKYRYNYIYIYLAVADFYKLLVVRFQKTT